jgi:hypothetical protein
MNIGARCFLDLYAQDVFGGFGSMFPNNRKNLAIAVAVLLVAGAGASYAGAAGNNDGYYPINQPPVYINQTQPAPVPAPEQPVATQYAQGQYAARQPARYTRYREHHHHRSKKRSLAIVAGTAATGAAIGAIAGGGPGAAIGAIAGAGAGFTYDRLTHNH